MDGSGVAVERPPEVVGRPSGKRAVCNYCRTSSEKRTEIRTKQIRNRTEIKENCDSNRTESKQIRNEPPCDGTEADGDAETSDPAGQLEDVRETQHAHTLSLSGTRGKCSWLRPIFT